MVEDGRRGCIINIASTDGHQGNPTNIGYSTGKGGILNFTRCAAMELALHGIRMNSITPLNPDPTDGLERAARWGVQMENRSGNLAAAAARIPLQRVPTSNHYAKAITFLASDDAEVITGEDLAVDGGTLACHFRSWSTWIQSQTPQPAER
jgi:NAD(P)-dependent dehydrogenase (short-subunit alcohol dehydrogenase family)